MIRRPPRSTLSSSSAASDVYKRQSEVDEAELPSLRSVKIAPVRGGGAVARAMAGFAAKAGPSASSSLSSSLSRPPGHHLPALATSRHSAGRVMPSPAPAQLVPTMLSPLHQPDRSPSPAATDKNLAATHSVSRSSKLSRRPVPAEMKRGQRLRRIGGPGGSNAGGSTERAARSAAVNTCEA